MDYDMLNMYKSGTFKQQPDIADTDDIIAMEWWRDKLLGRDTDNTNTWDDSTPTGSEQPTWDNTQPTWDNATTPWEATWDNTQPTWEQTEEPQAWENQAQPWDTQDTDANTSETDWWDEWMKKDIEDWDFDNLVNNYNEQDINMELLKELEKSKLNTHQIQTKYDVLRKLYDKIMNEYTTMQEWWYSNSDVPDELKWLNQLYVKYNSDKDDEAKAWLIDKLSSMLTDLTSKDVFSFVQWKDKTNDIADLDSTWNWDVSKWLHNKSSDKEDEDYLDPKVLKEFWTEVL